MFTKLNLVVGPAPKIITDIGPRYLDTHYLKIKSTTKRRAVSLLDLDLGRDPDH